MTSGLFRITKNSMVPSIDYISYSYYNSTITKDFSKKRYNIHINET